MASLKICLRLSYEWSPMNILFLWLGSVWVQQLLICQSEGTVGATVDGPHTAGRCCRTGHCHITFLEFAVRSRLLKKDSCLLFYVYSPAVRTITYSPAFWAWGWMLMKRDTYKLRFILFCELISIGNKQNWSNNNKHSFSFFVDALINNDIFLWLTGSNTQFVICYTTGPRSVHDHNITKNETHAMIDGAHHCKGQ